jgi:hypothetical protein
MPFCRGNIVRKALSGLLVLIILVLPVAHAGAAVLLAFNTASHVAQAGHGLEKRGSASLAADPNSGLSTDDCDDPGGPCCCLSCGSLVGVLPAIHSTVWPQAVASLRFMMSSTAPCDGLTGAPDLPPPRHIV